MQVVPSPRRPQLAATNVPEIVPPITLQVAHLSRRFRLSDALANVVATLAFGEAA